MIAVLRRPGNHGYEDEDVEYRRSPLPHHKAGLSWTSTGYGKRIPTEDMVKHKGRWRRVYCACFGNAASHYIGRIPNHTLVVFYDV